MVHRLEIPLHLAGVGVERNQRIAEQILAGPVSAIEVGAWSTDRGIENAALFIHREREGPDVVPGAILPAILGLPGFVAGLTIAWNRMEGPQFLARADVVGVLFGDLAAALI